MLKIQDMLVGVNIFINTYIHTYTVELDTLFTNINKAFDVIFEMVKES